MDKATWERANRRKLSITLEWGEVTRTLSIDENPDLGDVLVALHNMLQVNLRLEKLNRDGPWAKFAGQLGDLLVDAGFGPQLTLSLGRMTVGEYRYPAKPTGLEQP